MSFHIKCTCENKDGLRVIKEQDKCNRTDKPIKLKKNKKVKEIMEITKWSVM